MSLNTTPPVFVRLHDRSSGNEAWVNLTQVLCFQAAGSPVAGVPNSGHGVVIYLPANQVFVREEMDEVMKIVSDALDMEG